MIPLCNGFYLFSLSRAVKSNSLIFDPSEFKIDLYKLYKPVHLQCIYIKTEVKLFSCMILKTYPRMSQEFNISMCERLFTFMNMVLL